TGAEATPAANADELGGQPASSYALAAHTALKAYVLVNHITSGSNAAPSVVMAKSNPSGWGVNQPPMKTGLYCLTPPSNSGIDPTKATGVATIDTKLSANT